MYFETTMHTERPVADAAEVARLIHTGHVRDIDCLTWMVGNRKFAVVADNHCNSPWFEVAVIDLTNKVQIESITMGWIPGLETKFDLIKECETTDFQMKKDVTVPLDGEGGDTPANFECSCCGKYFTSTYNKQKPHDQDNGYGMCKECC